MQAGADAESVVLPVYGEQNSIDEFLEVIDTATKVAQLKILLANNGMKTSFKNKSEMMAALLMHNIVAKDKDDE